MRIDGEAVPRVIKQSLSIGVASLSGYLLPYRSKLLVFFYPCATNLRG